MIASAISMFPLSVFLAAALFVISYVMWETRIVYKLTASEALGGLAIERFCGGRL